MRDKYKRRVDLYIQIGTIIILDHSNEYFEKYINQYKGHYGNELILDYFLLKEKDAVYILQESDNFTSGKIKKQLNNILNIHVQNKKKNIMNYIIYGLEILTIHFKIYIFHLLAILMSLFAYIHHIKLFKKIKSHGYRILNVVYICILMIVSYIPIMNELYMNFLYPSTYDRIYYNFTDSQNERFVIETFVQACIPRNYLI